MDILPNAALRDWVNIHRHPCRDKNAGSGLSSSATSLKGLKFSRANLNSSSILGCCSFMAVLSLSRKRFKGKSCREFMGRICCRVLGASEWIAGQQETKEFKSLEDYTQHLQSMSKLPAGFRVGISSLKFVPQEAQEMGEKPMRLTLFCLDNPTNAYSAVFTSNAFPGAPVIVGRQRVKNNSPLQAIIVNNKISNVMPGDADGGVGASERVCERVAKELGLPGGGQNVLPCSTGVIGWRLPVDEMCSAVHGTVAALQSDSAYVAAEGIMTTDRYPKMSCADLPGGARLVGMVKGAGMIEPNMATMLGYLLTDAALPKSFLEDSLKKAVGSSFNSISVDGDESTSDTLILISSERCPVPTDEGELASFKAAFAEALHSVCQDLAAQVVHNGEGTSHVMRVSVSGATDDVTAKRIGRAVINGPLFKCAVAGNDPNVGRLVGKVGQALGREGVAMAEGTVCRIGGEAIFENGKFALDTQKEKRLSAHLKYAMADCNLNYPPHRRVVDIEVCLGGGGKGKAVVLGSDLTKEYVEINADYRS